MIDKVMAEDDAKDPLLDSYQGSSSGLHGPSVVKCCNLFTVAQADIQRIIGRLSEAMIAKLEACLKAALDLR